MQLEALEIPVRINFSGAEKVLAAIGAITALGALAIKMTADWAEKLDALSDKLGIATDAAAALLLVSKQTGVSNEELERGMNMLSKAATSNAKEFQALGIKVKDANGEFKTADVLMFEVAEKLNLMADGVEKTNIEMKLFGGKNGPKFYDMLRKMADAPGGMKDFIKQARAMGLVLSKETVDAFERIGQKSEFVKLQFQGFANIFGTKFTGPIEKFLNWFSEKLADPRILAGIQTLADLFSNAALRIGNFVTHLIDLLLKGDWKGAWDMLVTNAKTALDGLKDLWTTTIKPAILGVLDDAKKWLDEHPTIITDFINNLLHALITPPPSSTAHVIDPLDTVSNAIMSEIMRQIMAADWKPVAQTIWGRIVDSLNNLEKSTTGSAVALKVPFMFDFEVGFLATKNSIINIATQLVIDLTRIFNGLKVGVNKVWADMKWSFANMWSAMTTYLINQVNSWIKILNQFISSLNKLPNVHIGLIPFIGEPKPTKGRASGGPVIAGQSYNVAEFYKPEKFVPTTSGRISPMDEKQKPVWAVISDSGMREFARVLAEEMQKTARA